MPQKVRDRTYDSDDLRELMSAVAGWADGWDDVLWYLTVVAPHDHKLFRRERVQALAADIEHLARTGARFTTDYREVYREITRLECRSCPAPRATAASGLHLRQVAEKWLEGLRFPATKEDVLERAKHNHAPAEIRGALRQLRKSSYPSCGALLQELRLQTEQSGSLHPAT